MHQYFTASSNHHAKPFILNWSAACVNTSRCTRWNRLRSVVLPASLSLLPVLSDALRRRWSSHGAVRLKCEDRERSQLCCWNMWLHGGKMQCTAATPTSHHVKRLVRGKLLQFACFPLLPVTLCCISKCCLYGDMRRSYARQTERAVATDKYNTNIIRKHSSNNSI